MPRKSAAALEISAGPPLAPPRLQPPAGLASDERELFLDIVLGANPEHFQGADVPLLAAYVRACVLEQVAAAEIKRLMGDAPRSLLDTYARVVKTMYLLAMRLRLSPQARAPHLNAERHTKAPPPVSVYDRIRAGEFDGIEPT
jgi:hypothetical protein